jgi:hypothetical protein
MSKFKHHNPNSSKQVNNNTNKIIREKLREGEVIGTNFPISDATLQYGKINNLELIITVSNSRVIKVEEF